MKKTIIFLVIILAFHGFLITKLIFFPYPEFFVLPYLTNQGLVPYKQILDQHFPGLMYLPINFDNLGMTTSEIARVWLIAVTLLTQIMLFITARKIFKSDKKALGVCLFYLLVQPFFEGWVFWIENFLPLFYLPAFYLSYKFITDKKKHSYYIVLIGLLMGLSILFKQVALPLAFLLGALLFYYQRNLKTIFLYLIGLLPIPILMVVYFWLLGALKEFWFWGVWFNLTTYAKYGRPKPDLASITRVIGVFSPILLIPLINNHKLSLLLVVFLIGSLAGTLDRFGFIHFQPALPFLALIIVSSLPWLWGKLIGKLLIVGYFLVLIYWLNIFFRGHLSSKVLFFDQPTFEISQKIKSLTKPKEEIFIFGPVPHLYQLSQTIPAGRIFVYQFPWFLMESEDKFVMVLKTSTPSLVVRDRSVIIDGQSITKFAPKLDYYIEQNYNVIDKIGSTEFLKRK